MRAAASTRTLSIQTSRRVFSAKTVAFRTAAGVKSAAVKGQALGAAIAGNPRASGVSGDSGASGASGTTERRDTHFAAIILFLSARVRAFERAGRRLLKLKSAFAHRVEAVAWVLCRWRRLYFFASCLNGAIVLRAYLDSACGIR